MITGLKGKSEEPDLLDKVCMLGYIVHKLPPRWEPRVTAIEPDLSEIRLLLIVLFRMRACDGAEEPHSMSESLLIENTSKFGDCLSICCLLNGDEECEEFDFGLVTSTPSNSGAM